jgi:hypothetical protein
MSDNAIDSENISKAAPDTAKPKGACKFAKKARPKKAGRAKKTTCRSPIIHPVSSHAAIRS